MFDFHTHTFLSDGVLSPIELVRRAMKIGYRVMAITDHVGPGNMEYVLKTLVADCDMVNRRWGHNGAAGGGDNPHAERRH